MKERMFYLFNKHLTRAYNELALCSTLEMWKCKDCKTQTLPLRSPWTGGNDRQVRRWLQCSVVHALPGGAGSCYGSMQHQRRLIRSGWMGISQMKTVLENAGLRLEAAHGNAWRRSRAQPIWEMCIDQHSWILSKKKGNMDWGYGDR